MKHWLTDAIARGWRNADGYIAFDIAMARDVVRDWGGWVPLPLDLVFVIEDEDADHD